MIAADTPFQLDRDPTTDAVAEWLVISASADNATTAEAVSQARARGMRINHLLLAAMPVDDQLILQAAKGAKHIIVVESRAARFAADVRRVLPLIGVVEAVSATGPVPAELTLNLLLTTPRCC
jgi:3-keto-L-gulonate-6-phosphate decarboxylase